MLALVLFTIACQTGSIGSPAHSPLPDGVRLKDEKTAVVIGEDGRMLSLRNRQTGTDYAGGQGLWRLYYNTLERKEIEVTAAAQKPTVTAQAGVIRIAYDRLVCEGDTLEMGLELTVALEEGRRRFAGRLHAGDGRCDSRPDSPAIPTGRSALRRNPINGWQMPSPWGKAATYRGERGFGIMRRDAHGGGQAMMKTVQGDITEFEVDAVVNAANQAMLAAAELTAQYTVRRARSCPPPA